MDLNTLWFVLIAVLFAGFFVLDGFDFGVGMLLPFLGRDDRERRTMINAIGPFWDGNEVWLITAGGAMFAAFPNWYATFFSGFYLPLLLILVGMILRAVGIEFRSKLPSPAWRAAWDGLIALGSLLPALLFGVAIGNLLRGVPIDAQMNYVGGFWNLLHPGALLMGLTLALLFLLHGALFLALRTDGALRQRATAVARGLGLPAVLAAAAWLAVACGEINLVTAGAAGWAPAGAAVAALAASGALARKRPGVAFALTTAAIGLLTAAVFGALYPNVMPSSLSPQWNLTIHNASSSPYTLKVMTIITLTLLPLVLAYQSWSYWVFRRRLTSTSKLEY
ncbi:MAG: cytochrome d ubiquinol oxidase subunit II [Kiritimatiellaeota bacterium]|nr:cytochrome d ubiquinol oxidase subunit II [Kiritimatiellota bacterium]